MCVVLLTRLCFVYARIETSVSCHLHTFSHTHVTYTLSPTHITHQTRVWCSEREYAFAFKILFMYIQHPILVCNCALIFVLCLFHIACTPALQWVQKWVCVENTIFMIKTPNLCMRPHFCLCTVLVSYRLLPLSTHATRPLTRHQQALSHLDSRETVENDAKVLFFGLWNGYE